MRGALQHQLCDIYIIYKICLYVKNRFMAVIKATAAYGETTGGLVARYNEGTPRNINKL